MYSKHGTAFKTILRFISSLKISIRSVGIGGVEMLPCYANYFDTRNCILFYIFISATFDASMNPRYALCDMLYRDILLEHK